MSFAPALVCAVIGLLAGCITPELVKRTPMRMRIWSTPASCNRCGCHTKRFTQSHCHNCASALHPGRVAIALSTAVVFAVFGGTLGWSWALLAYLVFAHAAVSLTIIDVRHHVLPNRIVYPTLFAGLALLTIAALAGGDWSRLLSACIGMACAWLFFYVVWFIYPKGMGFGDVRLSAVIGLFTGWMGLIDTMTGLFVGLLLGAVGGVAFVVLRYAGMRDPIPYGPFLITGAVIAIFWGDPLAARLGY